MKYTLKRLALISAALIITAAFAVPAVAEITIPKVNIGITPAGNPKDVAATIQVLLLLTVLSLAPAILLLMTSFTRIVIVLSFLRQALGSQQIPPNQVIIGLALFMSFFVMQPTINEMNKKAWQPYMAGTINLDTAVKESAKPIRQFMFKQTREKDLALFVYLSKTARPKNQDDVPTSVLIPAFVISELKTAFTVGFMIFVPFLIIDMVVASVLMSMGMMMLPPVMISLPFKLLLFILVDGWHLISRALVVSF